MNITAVGIDLAKNVFQVHAVDARGKVCAAQAAAAGTGGRILFEYAAVLNWHGSLRERPPLGRTLGASGTQCV